MSAIITVVYPRPSKPETAFKFDYDYYYKVHLPLAEKVWGPMGLQSWTVTEHADREEPYFLQCKLVWNSMEDFNKAAPAAASVPVFADVDNFTDIKLLILKGNVVRTSTK